MRRGPRPDPDSLKRLKGNPGRRRLRRPLQWPGPAQVEVPDFLNEGEREMFRRLLGDAVMRRVVGRDVMPLARYVTYLRFWSDAKLALDAGEQRIEQITSKHGTRRARGASYAVMVEIERHLVVLEDRCGLNPESRQRLLHELALPPALLVEHEGDEIEAELPSPIGIGRRVN